MKDIPVPPEEIEEAERLEVAAERDHEPSAHEEQAPGDAKFPGPESPLPKPEE